MDRVRQSIGPFVAELGTDDIIQTLLESRNESAAEHCKQTLELVVDNVFDTVQNRIIDLLETVAKKMRPSIKRFLQEGAELLNQDNNHVEHLMRYLDDNLMALSQYLSTENFDRILIILWESVYSIINELVNDSLEKKRPPSFFHNLEKTFNTLVGFFKQNDDIEKNDTLDHIKKILKLYGMDTDLLIHHYYKERLTDQRNLESPSCGLLTVRVQFFQDTLKIEILNARNLMPHDSNGSCDPYVKISFLPEEKFSTIEKPRTKMHKKNLFPLFDETFSLQLTKEQVEIPSAMIHFVVKDQDFLSTQFVAEAFIPFEDIPKTNEDTPLHSLTQVHLKLSKPISFDSEHMKALEHRQGERLAREFIKKQKAKLLVNNINGK